MNVLAIRPGIRTLGYAAVEWHGTEGRVADADLVHHGGRGLSYDGVLECVKRAQVHWLVLSVVVERTPPSVVVLGSACDGREPRLHAEAMASVLRTCFRTFEVPVLDWSRPEQELLPWTELGARRRDALERARAMMGGFPCRNRQLVGACVLAAAAFARVYLPTRGDEHATSVDSLPAGHGRRHRGSARARGVAPVDPDAP